MSTSTPNLFARANRSGQHIKMALMGPSGGGKTLTSLLLAKHLATRNTADHPTIAVIDTESGRTEKHSTTPGVPPFDVIQLGPYSSFETYQSYRPKNFVSLMQMAASNGYEVVIIDSASHEWVGSPGGCLDWADSISGGNQAKNRQAWKTVTPEHNSFIEAIIGLPIHVIVTFRVKQARVAAEDDGKRPYVSRLGLEPITRSNPPIEYEFDFVGEIDLRHRFQMIKGYTLTDKVYQDPDKNLADDLLDWLRGADVLRYGDGNPVPDSPTTMRIFKAYQAAHGGAAPFDGNALKQWHTARDEIAETAEAASRDKVGDTGE